MHVPRNDINQPVCACLCVFPSLTNNERVQQALFKAVVISTVALFQREPAAKSLSMLNNSITAQQNTHSTRLKPEEFIDFKLLPFGAFAFHSQKKKKRNNSTIKVYTSVCESEVNQTSVQMSLGEQLTDSCSAGSVQMAARER